MKKYFVFALACVATVAAFVSCDKEIIISEQKVPAEGQLITISATIPTNGLTRVDLAEQEFGGAIKLAWQAGDVITVTDASNPSNTQNFTLSAGEGTASGTFTGTALAKASSYNISYDALGPDYNYAEQTQEADGSLSHLKYAATLSGVSSYETFTLSEAWAASNGGTFASSSVLRVRADVPFDIADIKAVYIKAGAPLYAGGKEIKVNITTPGDQAETDIITVYANLPAGDQAIEEGTDFVLQFQVSDNDYDKFTAYRKLGAMTLKAGKVNSIAIDCNSDQDITKYANKNADDIGTESNPYIIGDQHQLALMYTEVKEGSTVYFKIVDDIDMTGVDWIPFNYASPYTRRVVFDGGNHIISNLTVDHGHIEEEQEVEHGYPSFAGVGYGVIKDVTFDKASISAGSNNTGIVAGYLGTNVKEVGDLDVECSGITVSNSTITATAAKDTRNSGMFAGVLATAGSSVTNCHVTGENYVEQTNTANKGCSVGGFIGNITAAATIENCTATADMNNAGSYYTGGFIGQIGSQVKASITNCAFLGGKITAGRSNNNSPVGGFIGRIAGGAGVSIEKCYVDAASISAPNSGRVGGFVGDAGSNATPNCFVSCYVSNSIISGGINSGGFAGTYGSASKCYVESTTINANKDNAGGFIAYLENSIVSDCYATVTIEGGANKNIGGFVGSCRLGGNIPSKVTYCFANGTVSGSEETVGAFIGGVDAVPASVTKNIAWNGTLPFYGSAGELDVTAAIVDNYVGTEGSISAQATTLGWDNTIWDLSGSVPALQ